MGHKMISPKNDIIFKALFGHNDDIPEHTFVGNRGT